MSNSKNKKIIEEAIESYTAAIIDMVEARHVGDGLKESEYAESAKMNLLLAISLLHYPRSSIEVLRELHSRIIGLRDFHNRPVGHLPTNVSESAFTAFDVLARLVDDYISASIAKENEKV